MVVCLHWQVSYNNIFARSFEFERRRGKKMINFDPLYRSNVSIIVSMILYIIYIERMA